MGEKQEQGGGRKASRKLKVFFLRSMKRGDTAAEGKGKKGPSKKQS